MGCYLLSSLLTHSNVMFLCVFWSFAPFLPVFFVSRKDSADMWHLEVIHFCKTKALKTCHVKCIFDISDLFIECCINSCCKHLRDVANKYIVCTGLLIPLCVLCVCVGGGGLHVGVIWNQSTSNVLCVEPLMNWTSYLNNLKLKARYFSSKVINFNKSRLILMVLQWNY